MIVFQDLVDETQAGEVISEEKTLSVIDLIVNGGAGSIVIISVLFVMLAVALYIYFERILAIKAASSIDKALKAAQERGEITYTFSENVANTDYERVMREYAEQGMDLVVG